MRFKIIRTMSSFLLWSLLWKPQPITLKGSLVSSVWIAASNTFVLFHHPFKNIEMTCDKNRWNLFIVSLVYLLFPNTCLWGISKSDSFSFIRNSITQKVFSWESDSGRRAVVFWSSEERSHLHLPLCGALWPSATSIQLWCDTIGIFLGLWMIVRVGDICPWQWNEI